MGDLNYTSTSLRDKNLYGQETNNKLNKLNIELLNFKKEIKDILNNTKVVTSVSVCVDNKPWIKSLFFNSVTGLLTNVIWTDETGSIVLTLNTSLINDCSSLV